MYTHLEIVVVKASEEKKMKKAAVECLLSGVSLRFSFSVHHLRIKLSVVERIRSKEPLDVRYFNCFPFNSLLYRDTCCLVPLPRAPR